MKHSIFPFGETLDGYSVPVLNERAVRAGAGILFFFAMVTFMNAWLLGDFAPTRLFIVVFMVDFSIRLFVSPKYAPSLIVGQFLVRKQMPEYTGAAQKAFAWAIGFVLSVAMFYLMVVNQYMGPINMLICATCLVLMWFETSAGICIGCKIYNLFAKDPAQLCPGSTCAYVPVKGAAGSGAQAMVLLVFLGAFFALAKTLTPSDPPSAALSTPAAIAVMPKTGADASTVKSGGAPESELARCVVPDFAKAIGHEAMWKKHNNCP